MSNGLWSELGASDIVQSCGAELAEVLTQVDLLIEKKREEWDIDLKRAEQTANAALQRENESKRRLQEQQNKYELTISSLRVDLGQLKEAYLKLEKHKQNKPEKYKKIIIEKKSKLELTERELKNYKQHNEALQTENAQLKIQIKNSKLEKDSDRLKLIMAQKEIEQLSDVKDENEMLNFEIEKIKRKYCEVKKMAGKMSQEMKNERNAFIDSVSKIQSTPR
jgi:DNA repair exonuclease SbcCD ATPase subunit